MCCTIGSTLFAVVLSWLTIDCLFCGKLQWIIFGSRFCQEGYCAYLGKEQQRNVQHCVLDCFYSEKSYGREAEKLNWLVE